MNLYRSCRALHTHTTAFKQRFDCAWMSWLFSSHLLIISQETPQAFNHHCKAIPFNDFYRSKKEITKIKTYTCGFISTLVLITKPTTNTRNLDLSLLLVVKRIWACVDLSLLITYKLPHIAFRGMADFLTRWRSSSKRSEFHELGSPRKRSSFHHHWE